MNKETLFTLYDLDIKSDTVYQVTPKPDANAPEGFQRHGTTKILNANVDNEVPGAIYDYDKNAWDTGLYIESRALNKAFPNETERKAALKNIDKFIVKPIEKIKGNNALTHLKENNTFWDEYRVKLKKGGVFYTNKPEDLLNLFLVVLHRQLMPSHLSSGNPEFAKAQYCIQDKDSVVDREQQLEMEQTKATGLFYNLLTTKKKDLIVILDYVGKSVSEGSDEAAITSIFQRFIRDKKDGIQNTQEFLRTADKMASDSGETELYIYDKLKKLSLKDKVKQRKNQIFLDDLQLGSNFKEAAKFIMADKKLQKEILEIE